MNEFKLLGSLAVRLHGEFQSIFYLMLPVAFALALVMAWFRCPGGGADFVEALMRVFVATLLVVGFQEISEAILSLTSAVADRISDMSGLEAVITMAAEKTKAYTLSPLSMLEGVNDLIVAVLTFLSFMLLYVARYVMVALYHFGWVFLTMMAPLLLLFHVLSPKITANLFKSMVEIASWRIVWAALSAMLQALPFGTAYAASDSGYITAVVMNFVIALCMLGTPLVVHALVGSGFSGLAAGLSPAVTGAMLAAPVKAGAVVAQSRGVLTTLRGGPAASAGIGQGVSGRRNLNSGGKNG